MHDSHSDIEDDEMIRFDRCLRPVPVLLAVTVLAGCDDVTSPEFDDQMTLDAAMLAADATVEEVTMWSQPFGFSQPAAAPGSNPATIGRPGGDGTWSGEFSGTRSVTFYDENGVEQTEYDPLLTESINIVREIEGTIVRGTFTAEIHRERDMTVSGLLGEETHRTWNGGGSSLTARSGVLDDGSERSHTVEGSYEFEDVVVPIPGSDNPWPVSGTITRVMTVTRDTPDGVQTREVTIVITFDGTSTATAVVNGEVMEIDLTARDQRRPLRRRP